MICCQGWGANSELNGFKIGARVIYPLKIEVKDGLEKSELEWEWIWYRWNLEEFIYLHGKSEVGGGNTCEICKE